jgi:hypothetical protein
MIRKRSAEACAGDDMPESQGPNIIERSSRISREWFRLAFSNLLNFDQWHFAEIFKLLQGKKLLWATHDCGL